MSLSTNTCFHSQDVSPSPNFQTLRTECGPIRHAILNKPLMSPNYSVSRVGSETPTKLTTCLLKLLWTNLAKLTILNYLKNHFTIKNIQNNLSLSVCIAICL